MTKILILDQTFLFWLIFFYFLTDISVDNLPWQIIPVLSMVPSRITIISKGSFCISASDNSQNGDFSLISWYTIKGVTKNNLSAPVSNPILISVWSNGINSPSSVCRDRTNFARILHWTISEFRRLPTLEKQI